MDFKDLYDCTDGGRRTGACFEPDVRHRWIAAGTGMSSYGSQRQGFCGSGVTIRIRMDAFLSMKVIQYRRSSSSKLALDLR